MFDSDADVLDKCPWEGETLRVYIGYEGRLQSHLIRFTLLIVALR